MSNIIRFGGGSAPSGTFIYGVKIDTLNSNPATAVTYIDDAVGLIPAAGNNGAFNGGSWLDKFPFNQIKPCLVNAGVVNYYLNPNNYAQKADLSASDITSGTAGDVMSEFPKIYWKIETIGNDIYIRYSSANLTGYKCLAHMRGTTEKPRCYVSAYDGSSLSGKLRSLSGQLPVANQTIRAFGTLAETNGVGYTQMAFYQLLMLQVLFVVMFKGRDSQTALGIGYVDETNASAIATGGANAKGMYYGETTGNFQNKFCGIEDFYGNVRYWIDGFFSNATRNMLIANQNFNNTGTGYADYGQGAVANISGYISAIQGTTETGFVAKAVAGSATTHYCDYGNLAASSFPLFGGNWTDGTSAGAFFFNALYSTVTASGGIGARLMFL